MRVKNHKFLPFLSVSLIIVFSNSPINALSISPYTPEIDKMPTGLEHVTGFDFTSGEEPLYLGVNHLRIDFWQKSDSPKGAMSITLISGEESSSHANPFNQDAPPPLADNIEIVSQNFNEIIPIGVVSINTIWNLLTDGVNTMSLLTKQLELFTGTAYSTEILNHVDNPYIEDGFVLYSAQNTLAYALDLDMAIIVIDCSIPELHNNDKSWQEDANGLISTMNSMVDELFGFIDLLPSNEPMIVPNSAGSPVIDKTVLDVLEHISLFYGDNYRGDAINAFPYLFIIILSLNTIYALFKKTSNKRNGKLENRRKR